MCHPMVQMLRQQSSECSQAKEIEDDAESWTRSARPSCTWIQQRKACRYVELFGIWSSETSHVKDMYDRIL